MGGPTSGCYCDRFGVCPNHDAGYEPPAELLAEIAAEDANPTAFPDPDPFGDIAIATLTARVTQLEAELTEQRALVADLRVELRRLRPDCAHGAAGCELCV